MHRIALVVSCIPFVALACATSQPSPGPQPTASTAGTATTAPVAAAAPEPPKAIAPPEASSGGVDAKYRACATAADCVAVEPVGCCHDGRKVAVAAAQKDAYLASFVCTQRRPICPMIRFAPDGRVPSCDQGLCALKAP